MENIEVVAMHNRISKDGFNEVCLYSNNIDCILRFEVTVSIADISKEIRTVLLEANESRYIGFLVSDTKSFNLAQSIKQCYCNTLNIKILNILEIAKQVFSIKKLQSITKLLGINKNCNPDNSVLIAKDIYLVYTRIQTKSGECLYSMDLPNLSEGKYEKYIKDEINKTVLEEFNVYETLLHYLKLSKVLNSTRHKMDQYKVHLSHCMHVGRTKYSGNFSELYLAKSMFFKKEIHPNIRTLTLNKTINTDIPNSLDSLEALEYLRTSKKDYWDFKNEYVDEADKLERRLADILVK